MCAIYGRLYFRQTLCLLLPLLGMQLGTRTQNRKLSSILRRELTSYDFGDLNLRFLVYKKSQNSLYGNTTENFSFLKMLDTHLQMGCILPSGDNYFPSGTRKITYKCRLD